MRIILETVNDLDAFCERVIKAKPDAPPAIPTVYPADVRALLEAYRDSRPIDCIRAIRTLTGMGLKESKDLYEGVRNRGLAQPRDD